MCRPQCTLHELEGVRAVGIDERLEGHVELVQVANEAGLGRALVGVFSHEREEVGAVGEKLARGTGFASVFFGLGHTVVGGEVADQDTWDLLTLGFYTVGPERGPVEQVLRAVLEHIEGTWEGEVIAQALRFERY